MTTPLNIVILAPLELNEQRIPFHLHAANFYYALAEAERLAMAKHVHDITQCLAVFAQNTGSYPQAADLFHRLAEHSRIQVEVPGEAAAYHQLGKVRLMQGDLAAATRHFERAIAIWEQIGAPEAAARAYVGLAGILVRQRDFDRASELYEKALIIHEGLHETVGIATALNGLGELEMERNPEQALHHFQRCLATANEPETQWVIANVYHSLSIIMLEKNDLSRAEELCRQSVSINERLERWADAATGYHQIGLITQRRGKLEEAYQWYLRSAQTKERLGLAAQAASSYQQLGNVSNLQNDLGLAAAWYEKSLDLKERGHNWEGAAITLNNLATVRLQQRAFEEAGQLLIRSLAYFERVGRRDQYKKVLPAFNYCYQQSDPGMRERLNALWTGARLGEFPNPEP